jgi:uncharacterized protein (DUF4415 family)
MQVLVFSRHIRESVYLTYNYKAKITCFNHNDFSKSVKNPYAKFLKKQVTLRLNVDVVDYFLMM